MRIQLNDGADIGGGGMTSAGSIYIVGGHVRQNLFRKLEEWQSCDRARIVQLGPEENRSHVCVEYSSSPELCSDNQPAILFKAASICDKTLYACTSTEVLVYKLPGFEQVRRISLPCFNDLHHVCPTSRGTLAVAVTGLDMVVEITSTGELVREWSVLGEEPWAHFSRTTDYRKVQTTKPHRSHPDHIFEWNGELWVTRFEQRDAICLTSPGRIDIAVERPHDGLLFGGSLYFTTVDGHIVIADPDSRAVTRIYDLNKMHSQPRQILGWCRGLLPVDERYIWVGFTRVRPTKFKENLAWIRNKANRHKSSHIGLYDLKEQRSVREIAVEPHGIGVVFSLFHAS
ncbi:MAG TPA: hypothetical protein VMP68_15325 [Candidatus Eisenbacteria bacterium]|nr:hypothetical protein [Candidatus Eisenbacteria bacterium]